MAIFDIDVADAIIARLNGYSYDEEGQRILSELSAAVRNMDVLSVDSLVDEWK